MDLRCSRICSPRLISNIRNTLPCSLWLSMDRIISDMYAGPISRFTRICLNILFIY
ncbi:hypothetical protein BDV24DRAFT_144579 [Aspergillus arachidicola]|uniref:Uncharacterized protein n=1 Tax=Aspergillus arachidicola TaxID=656916 RepID=A0A5N6XPD9_9EURO|nr:hypothetical protein BDV24DRAFT_144579 [Aspergillus arachidicola]